MNKIFCSTFTKNCLILNPKKFQFKNLFTLVYNANLFSNVTEITFPLKIENNIFPESSAKVINPFKNNNKSSKIILDSVIEQELKGRNSKQPKRVNL